MKSGCKFTALAHLFGALCLSVSAQSTTFTYQGRLGDGANPASGNYDLAFSLFSTVSGAGQVGGTVTNSIAVSNGLFTVALDFGNQFPGADRWLEIAVRTNGGNFFTIVAPRQPLTPTPYALTAANFSGAVSVAQLPAGIITNGASDVNFAGTFTGNGAGLTNNGGWNWMTNLVQDLAHPDFSVIYVAGEARYGWNGVYVYIGSNCWTNATLAATLGFNAHSGNYGLWTNLTAFDDSYDLLDDGGGYGSTISSADDVQNLPNGSWFTWENTDVFHGLHVSFNTNYVLIPFISTGGAISGSGMGLSNVVAANLSGGGIGNVFTNPVFKMSTTPASKAYLIVTNRTLQLPFNSAQNSSLCLYSVVDPTNRQLSSIGFLDGALLGAAVGRFAGLSWFPYHSGAEMELTIGSAGSMALGWADESLLGIALQPNRSLQIGINPSEYGRLENIYIQGNYNSYANPNMGFAIPLSFNSGYKSNGASINQLMTLWAHATTTNGESRLSLYDNWNQSATPDKKSHNFSNSVLRAEFITKSAGAEGGLDVYGRLWSTNFVGNGAGLTNLSFTGYTNDIPPTNTTVVKAWLNFTNATGGVFKMPLYQ